MIFPNKSRGGSTNFPTGGEWMSGSLGSHQGERGRKPTKTGVNCHQNWRTQKDMFGLTGTWSEESNYFMHKNAARIQQYLINNHMICYHQYERNGRKFSRTFTAQKCELDDGECTNGSSTKKPAAHVQLDQCSWNWAIHLHNRLNMFIQYIYIYISLYLIIYIIIRK